MASTSSRPRSVKSTTSSSRTDGASFVASGRRRIPAFYNNDIDDAILHSRPSFDNQISAAPVKRRHRVGRSVTKISGLIFGYWGRKRGSFQADLMPLPVDEPPQVSGLCYLLKGNDLIPRV